MTTATRTPVTVRSIRSVYAGLPAEITVQPEGWATTALYIANDIELDTFHLALTSDDGRVAVRTDLLIPSGMLQDHARQPIGPVVTHQQEEE